MAGEQEGDGGTGRERGLPARRVGTQTRSFFVVNYPETSRSDNFGTESGDSADRHS